MKSSGASSHARRRAQRRVPFMRCAVSAVAMVALTCLGTAAPDQGDLEYGVLLVHHPVGLEFTSDGPPLGDSWCDYYAEVALDSIGQQNPTVPAAPLGEPSVWYVVAAWSNSKAFSGLEFGFGQFDGNAYAFADYGPCWPSGGGYELSTDGWPGGNCGTALVTADGPWEGAIVPVYWFGGYAYSDAEIPIEANPATGFCGFGNDEQPADTFPVRTSRRGVLGVGADGTAVFPHGTSSLELIAWFKPGVVNFPEGTTHGSLEMAGISPASLDSVLEYYGIDHIAQCFPDFQRYDPRAVNSQGDPVALVDVSEIHKLRVQLSDNRDDLVDALNDTVFGASIADAHLNGSFRAAHQRVEPNDELFHLQ